MQGGQSVPVYVQQFFAAAARFRSSAEDWQDAEKDEWAGGHAADDMRRHLVKRLWMGFRPEVQRHLIHKLRGGTWADKTYVTRRWRCRGCRGLWRWR